MNKFERGTLLTHCLVTYANKFSRQTAVLRNVVYYLFLQDDTCNNLPAFGGVFGAGFFFTVASPSQKKIQR